MSLSFHMGLTLTGYFGKERKGAQAKGIQPWRGHLETLRVLSEKNSWSLVSHTSAQNAGTKTHCLLCLINLYCRFLHHYECVGPKKANPIQSVVLFLSLEYTHIYLISLWECVSTESKEFQKLPVVKGSGIQVVFMSVLWHYAHHRLTEIRKVILPKILFLRKWFVP